MQLIPGTTIERYTIEGVLGEGGMAVVYRARHRELESLHAIKLLTVPGSKIRDRLVQEGRLQSSLKHPNVLSVTDLLTIDGAPALVMEYVRGPSLADLLARYRPSLEQCDALARDILRGVVAAHAHGMIHRDLKPSNILVAITDDALVPKIADFGLAKVVEGPASDLRSTRTGASMGTPGYMSPEQIADSSSVDARADVFSLGAILYELITGQLCFGEGSVLDIWKRITEGDVPSMQGDPSIPVRMTRAIEGALVVDADARIPDVSTLLQTWSTDEQGQHVPTSQTATRIFWSGPIREEAEAVASQIEKSLVSSVGSEGSGKSTLDFSTGGALSPLTEDSSTRMIPDLSAGPSHPEPSSPPGNPGRVFGIAAAAVIGGLWLIVQQNSVDDESAAIAETVSDAEPVAELESAGSSQDPEDRIFKLSDDASAVEQQSFSTAIDAMLAGENGLAERLLIPLHESWPDDPAIEILLSLNHAFRGRNALAVVGFQRAEMLVRDLESPLADLITLSNRTFREPGNRDVILPRWESLRSESSDPMVDVMFLCTINTMISTVEFLEVTDGLMEKYPDWVLLYLLKVDMLSAVLGRHTEGLRVAEEGVARHPSSAFLGFSLGMVLSRIGELERAREALTQVLIVDASLSSARIALAGVLLKLGDEPARQEQMHILLGDTTHGYDKVSFSLAHGVDMAWRGQLAEAEWLWMYCIPEAQKQGDFGNTTKCASTALKSLVLLKEPREWAPWMERLEATLAQPELDPDVRQIHAVEVLLYEAIGAARTGNPGEALAILERIGTFDDQSLPFSSREGFIRRIKLEIELSRGNRSELEGLLSEMKEAESYTYSSGKHSCDLAWIEVRMGESVEDQSWVEEALQRIIAGECNDYSSRLYKPMALVKFAELRAARSDMDGAREMLEAFRLAWPNADTGLDLVQRADRLEASL